MNNFTKFFLGFLFIALMFDLMLIDRKKNINSMVNLFATFNKIDGVNKGTDVVISGIKVGEVREVYIKNNYPQISLDVDKNIKISDDSSVSIQTDGLFGRKFLLIEIGGNDNILLNGDKFIFSEDSIVIEELLQKIIEIGEKKKKL